MTDQTNPAGALAILQKASRGVPNEDYVEFMAAIESVAELVAAASDPNAQRSLLFGMVEPSPTNNRIRAAKARLAAALARVSGGAA